jgi:hypothetical protein
MIAALSTTLMFVCHTTTCIQASNSLMKECQQKLTVGPLYRKSVAEADNFLPNEQCSSAVLGDGPSITLLEYMKERNYKAPADWAGFRPLTSK